MYTMVMMAALTTGIDMPDRRGRRGGGCWGCYGCYGMSWGGCCGGWGGCYGMSWGGCYGMSWGGGYGGYALGSIAPMMGSYAYSPMMTNWGWGNALASREAMVNPATTQSFYFGGGNTANAATIVVHLPEGANLTIDGEQTQQRSATRTFTSPPLEPGKVYTYTLRAEINRDGHTVRDTKTIDVRAGQRSETTMMLSNANREEEVRVPTSP
jgi:uncharacterized protein (TIGR03000 family)